MEAASHFDWTREADQRRSCDEHDDHDEHDEGLLEHLRTGCILLLLHETAACSVQLHSALAGLRLHEDPAALQCALEAMEDTGLVFSTWGPAATVPRRHTFHIAPAGDQWLRHAASDLRSTEGFLGAFVARCGEHLA
jgi:DNA-binding PadR family transcriptional regulator